MTGTTQAPPTAKGILAVEIVPSFDAPVVVGRLARNIFVKGDAATFGMVPDT